MLSRLEQYTEAQATTPPSRLPYNDMATHCLVAMASAAKQLAWVGVRKFPKERETPMVNLLAAVLVRMHYEFNLECSIDLRATNRAHRNRTLVRYVA